MKFDIINDTTHGVCTWVLVTNSGDIIATSSTPYTNVPDAQAAVQQFKAWVQQAPVEIVQRFAEKDWKQQAKDQLKKTPWQKG